MIIYAENLVLKITYRIAETLAKKNIKANHVTIARFIIAAPLSYYFFSKGSYLYNIIGLFSYMTLGILDWVDGKLARLTGQSSLSGKLLDDILDKILILIVLGSMSYAGLTSPSPNVWMILTIVFYSIFFLSAIASYEFDQMFNTEFKRYPDFEKEMYQLNPSPCFTDRLLYKLLYVHNNSITKFCFGISYPLFLGIITNQIVLTFVFIVLMHGFRTSGILFVMYRSARKGKTHSALINVLRKSLSKSEERHKATDQISKEEDKLVK